MPQSSKASIPFQVVMMIFLSTGGSVAQPVDSFGRSVPLGVAIQRIVPEGTSVKVVPSSLEERRVSWTAGPDWRQVLRRAVQGAGLRVREEGGVVIIEAPPPPPPQPTVRPATPEAPGARGLPGDQPLQQSPGFVLSSTQTGGSGSSPSTAREEPPSSGAADGQRSERQTSRSDQSVGRQSQSRPQSSPQRAVSENGVWRAQRGQTLDQVLSEWSERAGWTLVFNTPIIYEIQAGAELRGDFIDAAASLINSIQARPLPRAVFYRGNRVLVVSNSFEVPSQ